MIDTSAVAADEVVAQSELRVETKALLSELPEREAEIIRLRFGLGGEAERTLEEDRRVCRRRASAHDSSSETR